MPLYRLTFKREDGKTSQVKLKARNFPEVFRLEPDIFHVIWIERLNRINGRVIAGTYKEQAMPKPAQDSVIMLNKSRDGTAWRWSSEKGKTNPP